MTNHRNLCAHASLLLAVGGCLPDGGSTSDSELSAVDTVRAELITQFGLEETKPDAVFGKMTTIAVDELGRTYVADRLDSTVRVYNECGSFVRTLAREGEGPGELQWPADIVFGFNGALWIRDAYRLTVLAPRTAGALPDSLTLTIAIPGNASLLPTRSRPHSLRARLNFITST